MLPTGAAVELVDPDLSAAQLVRHSALRPHILLKIRRRVILPLFMQKGKIKYIIVLLVWDRKLQLTVALITIPTGFTRTLTCAWHHSTKKWMDLQNNGIGLERATRNFWSRARLAHMYTQRWFIPCMISGRADPNQRSSHGVAERRCRPAHPRRGEVLTEEPPAAITDRGRKMESWGAPSRQRRQRPSRANICTHFFIYMTDCGRCRSSWVTFRSGRAPGPSGVSVLAGCPQVPP